MSWICLRSRCCSIYLHEQFSALNSKDLENVLCTPKVVCVRRRLPLLGYSWFWPPRINQLLLKPCSWLLSGTKCEAHSIGTANVSLAFTRISPPSVQYTPQFNARSLPPQFTLSSVFLCSLSRVHRSYVPRKKSSGRTCARNLTSKMDLWLPSSWRRWMKGRCGGKLASCWQS